MKWNLIEEFLQVEPSFIDRPKDVSDSPSDWQFDQLEKIVEQYSTDSVCIEIFKSYDPAKHNRNLIALMLTMLRWFSREHEKAVFTYLKISEFDVDKKILGVMISKRVEWLPFGTPRKTLKAISHLRIEYPEFKEDFDYWEVESELILNADILHLDNPNMYPHY